MLNNPEATRKALAILRSGENFQWYVIPIFALVVYLYLDKNRDAPEGIFSTIQYRFFIEDNKFIELGPKFEDDRFRFSKIEQLVDELIQKNYIVFFDKPRDAQYAKGRVNIKLKNH